MGTVQKVCKVYLISKTIDKNGELCPYKDINGILWDLQKQTREFKNKAVREYWEWDGFANDYAKNHDGTYPKPNDILGYSLDGFIDNKYRNLYDFNTGNKSTTLRQVGKHYRSNKKDMLVGKMSIMQYKANQPLDLHNQSVKLKYDKETDKFSFSLSLLCNEALKKYDALSSGRFIFEAVVKDSSTRTILERCYDGIYAIGASKLIYDTKKKQWKLNLIYKFEKEVNNKLDENKILGVNLGVLYPLCASVYGSKKRLIISGDEIIEFRKRIEARRISLKRQSGVCGDGRIGHGYKTRMKPVLRISDKIARFRDTFNHKVSRKLIEYAVKNNCGIIQMENLKGITADAEPFLKDWSYYDLQEKIKNKADEVGIDVVYIEPRYTSQRCSHCGNISAENHPTRDNFICSECGFEALHDYNASQNIAISDIDEKISARINAMILSELVNHSVPDNDDWFCYEKEELNQATTFNDETLKSSIKELKDGGFIEFKSSGKPEKWYFKIAAKPQKISKFIKIGMEQ